MDDETPRDSTSFLQGVADSDNDEVGIIIFPSLHTESELVELLNCYHADPRWRLVNLASEAGERRIGLQWKNDDDEWSVTMGFAPLRTMLATRRAPYFAIAVWPGPRNTNYGETVSFKDIPRQVSSDEEQNLKTKTEELCETLLQVDIQNSKHSDRWWREVAF
ncbi:MAG: hypothetical protein KC561_17460, partial [Myxococcales bacterium]|nr:hypothetical protein [Myxococcales bacterium]